ncbi:hypothetical protein AB9128_30435 [Streptomyces cinereoruber]|uniref:hypothetical protein n=1 Tax=Streptomyces cinereoruber TaxID=67260 RepID=UPI003EBA9BAF
MSGPDTGRTHARMPRVSTPALLLEGGLALAVGVVTGRDGEPEAREYAGGGLFLAALPCAVVFWFLAAVVASAALVLPVVLLGEDLGRRLGARPLWWHLALAALAGALLAPFAGVRGWLVAWAALAGAALLRDGVTSGGPYGGRSAQAQTRSGASAPGRARNLTSCPASSVKTASVSDVRVIVPRWTGLPQPSGGLPEPSESGTSASKYVGPMRASSMPQCVYSS